MDDDLQQLLRTILAAHPGGIAEHRLLKQLQIDLARIKGVAVTGAEQTRLLREKSDELSNYVQDLKHGYSELESSE